MPSVLAHPTLIKPHLPVDNTFYLTIRYQTAQISPHTLLTLPSTLDLALHNQHLTPNTQHPSNPTLPLRATQEKLSSVEPRSGDSTLVPRHDHTTPQRAARLLASA